MAPEPPAKITLYHNERTRSQVVYWYLNELGVEFFEKTVDMSKKEHKSEEYLAINPFGKLPALTCGDVTVFESGAILLYLAEIVGGADTAAKRAELAQWVLFANSTLYDALFQPSENTTLAKVMEPLDSILSKKTYLIGDALTAADIAVGSSLLYAQMFIKLDLSAYPNVHGYCTRLQARNFCPMKPTPPSSN